MKTTQLQHRTQLQIYRTPPEHGTELQIYQIPHSTANMPSTTLRPWTREEIEQLIGWMEDNQEQLRGKQVAWYKEVKEQAFANEDHITVKRISEKIGNIKKA
ncbi:hypothetical protein EV426DRAFT_699314 [Tirmania nivea]|nr:hypothetical protein EV426DRAFT_699314 [Tirmania nivea]